LRNEFVPNGRARRRSRFPPWYDVRMDGSRKRRIVRRGTLFVGVAIAVWWATRAPVDRRFVGCWRVGYVHVASEAQSELRAWRFDADGRGAFTEGGVWLQPSFTWSVSDNRLCTTPRQPGREWEYLKLRLRQIYEVAIGDPVVGRDEYRFNWINSDTCELEGVHTAHGAGPLRLVRIQEPGDRRG
jgi:hypothetical protein